MTTERNDLLARLLDRWAARSRGALPADAMLINLHIRELREARAAFAELIAAANYARETGGMGCGYTPAVDRRLAAALACVGAA